MKEKNIPFHEVKIRTVYIEENKSSHFRAVRDSWRIYKLILAHFFRYSISAIVSSVVDTGLYALLSAVLNPVLSGVALTSVAVVVARAVSSLCNFFMNKKLVFNSDVQTGKAMLRYYMIAVPNMLLQLLFTQGVYAIFGIPDSAIFLRSAIYVAVMCVLFVMTFILQQRWVFASKNSPNEANIDE